MFMKLRDWIDYDKLNLNILSENSNILKFLEYSQEKNVCLLLKSKINKDKIDCSNLNLSSKNNLNKIYWDNLSLNSITMKIFEENPEKINWRKISANPNAIELLKENPTKIDWTILSKNPNAIELLKENPKKINWNYLSSNPAIFTYNYEKIRKNFEELGEEIIAKALHPKRIFRLIAEYGEDEIYDNYFE